MDGGMMHASEEGTPQGSPLSPLLVERDARRPRPGAGPARASLRPLRRRPDRLRRQRAGGPAGHAEHHAYVEQRLKLRVNREKSAVDRATNGPFWGSGSSSVVARSRCGSTRRLANGPRSVCAAHRPYLGRLDGAADPSRSTASRSAGRPTSGWPTPPRSSRNSTNGSAGACGRSAGRNGSARSTAAQPDRARNPRTSGPRVGRYAEGPLAHRRLAPSTRLPTPTGPSPASRIQRSLPPFPGCNANRRVWTRMPGGVGGAGVSPAPTRFSGFVKREPDLAADRLPGLGGRARGRSQSS